MYAICTSPYMVRSRHLVRGTSGLQHTSPQWVLSPLSVTRLSLSFTQGLTLPTCSSTSTIS
jgi:hypothetical protein